MAWGVPKLGTLVTDSTGNFDLIEPSGVAEGDLMIACIAYRGNAAITLPSNWNVAGTTQNTGDTDTTNGIASAMMGYIVRGASAPALTCTRTGGDVALVRVVSYSGGSATPYDTGSGSTLGALGNTATTGTITTAEAGELIVAMTSSGDSFAVSAFDAATDPTTASGAVDTTNAPTNGTWRQRHASTTTTGADNGLGIADAIRATAGATGTIQSTISSNARPAMIAAAFKLDNSLTITVSDSVTVTENRSVTYPTISLTQAEVAFYEDGTESGSTVIDAGADSITRDVSSGDSNLQLRLRLQETNNGLGSATDDYQLQYELNDSDAYYNVDSGGVIADSYVGTLASTNSIRAGSNTYAGQSFTGDGNYLNSVTWYISKSGSPTGTIYCEIYAHTGTYGSGGTPTGSPLSTASLDVSTLTGTNTAVDFTGFDNPLLLTLGTNYFAVLHNNNGDGANDVDVRAHVGTSHAGNNAFKTEAGAWGADGNDFSFVVTTGTPLVLSYNSASLTDGNATTNRLGAGTGSFIAGEISEDGLIDDLQITGSNYTELLYSLTIDSDMVADGDTLDFRILRNGVTTRMTYTVTPRITIEEGASDPTVSKSDTATLTESVTVNIDPKLVVETETATLTESVTVRLENYVINKSESITVTDTPTVQLGAQPDATISVSDSTTVTDTDNVILGNYTVNKSESATVTDTPVVSVDNLIINKSDTATLTESRTVLIPELNVVETETATVTDTPTVLIAERIVSVSDSTTVTDTDTVSIEVAGDYSVNVSDSATVSESLQRLVENRIAVSDSSTISESVTVRVDNYVISKSDTATVSESLQREANNRVSVSESATLTESLTVSRQDAVNYNVSVSDSSTITEFLLRETINTITETENLSVTESVTVARQDAVDRTVAVTDTATITEALQRQTENRVSVSDSATTNESLTVTITAIDDLAISRSDTATITELVQRMVEGRVAVTDTASITESSTPRIPELKVFVSDSITATESANAIIEAVGESYINVSESVTLSDYVTVLIPVLFTSTSENASITESTVVSVQFSVARTPENYQDGQGVRIV